MSIALQIYADDVTNQMIFSLNVVCDHYQLGCKWKGQLKKLEVISPKLKPLLFFFLIQHFGAVSTCDVTVLATKTGESALDQH